MPSRLAAGKKLVGVKQCRKALAAGLVSAIFVARDADPMLVAPLLEMSEQAHCEIVYVDTMRALGRRCGVTVPSAVAVLLK